MKIVKLDTSLEVNVSECDDNYFYGVENQLGDKGFIIKQRFDSVFFIVCCFSLLTKAVDWDALDEHSLRRIIKRLLEKGFKVYRFDTQREFLSWALKGLKD